MAGKQGKTGKQEAADVTPLDLTDVYDFNALNPALAKLYSEMGIDENEGQARVYVMKVMNDSGKEARVWEGPPEEYNLMATAKRHGSGDYIVRVHGPHESGRMVLRGKSDFAIQLDPVEDARIKLQREGAIAAAPQNSMTPEAMAALVVSAVKAAIPAQAAGPSIAEIIALAKAMQPAQPAVNPMEMLKAFAGIAREVQDDDPRPRGGSNGFDLMTKVVDKFAPLFERVLQAGAAGGVINPALAAPGAQGGELAAPPENEDMSIRLRMGLAFLIERAKENRDAAGYANMVIDTIGEEQAQALLDDPHWFAKLQAVHPDVGSHEAFFRELFSEIRDLMEPDDPVNGDSLTGGVEAGITH